MTVEKLKPVLSVILSPGGTNLEVYLRLSLVLSNEMSPLLPSPWLP